MEVLHVSPHPDDELIGAPATLLGLRDAGHTIVNFAASLGATADAKRRRAELEEATRRAGFELVVAREPFGSVSSSPAAYRQAIEGSLSTELAELISGSNFELVVGPSPHDRHPGHELVARAIRDVLSQGIGPDRWWLWRLWGDLPMPTTIVAFGEERVHEIAGALEAHCGELERNDYVELVIGRARATRILAAELVFGFGSPGLPKAYAEVTTEVIRDGAQWLLGQARILDPQQALTPATSTDIAWWLNAPSVTQRLEDRDTLPAQSVSSL